MLRNHDRVVGLVVMIFSASAFAYALIDLPLRVGRYPLFVTGLMFLLAFALFARSFSGDFKTKSFGAYFRHPRMFWLGLALTLAYFLAADYLGFLLATLLYIPALAWSAGYRSTRTLGLATVGYAAAVYLIFTIAFNRPLPQGVLEALLT